MFFVNLFNNDGEMFVHAPFDEKEAAIKFFNLRIDTLQCGFIPFHRIEIRNDNAVLFDYEV